MSPSPEKTEGQEPTTEPAQTPPEKRTTPGIQMEARVTSHTWEIGLSAVVHDFTPGEVILLVDDKIAEGTHVTIQLNTCSFTGVILFCEPVGARWEAHVSFDDVDATGLRRTPRFPVRIPARVFSASIDAPLEGTIVDISGEGLGIELPSALPLLANIAIQSEENTALGVVRHCRELSSGLFRTGVHLHHIVRKDLDLEKASNESGWMNKLGARFGRKKAERPKGWS
jgi:PilZ domain